MEGDSGLDVLSNDGILDIIPPSEYDPFEAKFCASLFWLVFHATEDGGLEDVPSTVTSPIQRLDKKNGFVVHPEIVEFLCKGEVYCIVCTRIFPGKVTLAGHWSVIQTLSRNGVYVVDNTDIAVTDASLEQNTPFNQDAHIALMDALMTAYASQVVSIQKVVQAVRRFSTFSASRELPFDLEDALLLWVNKTNVAVNAKYNQSTRSSSSGKLLRNREQIKKVGLRSEEDIAVVFPVIDDLLKGLGDGRSLLGVLMFYEPNVINIEDICCSSNFSTEDSIRNLDVFLGLCSQYFCTSVLALKVEDILYGSPSLKINIVALLAEMFSKCEGNLKTGHDIKTVPDRMRSKTACSENGDVTVNGHNSDDNVSGRSHSAPITRNQKSSGKSLFINEAQFDSGSLMNRSTTKDEKMPLKIQNYVESESIDAGVLSQKRHVLQDKITSSNITSENKTSSDTTSSNKVTSSTMTSSDDVIPPADEDTVEVQGVVVKLRKKVAKSVEPGGGHEALLSRRMKKGLCGWSQEESSDTASQTSDQEEMFDAKSDEKPDEKPSSSHVDISDHSNHVPLYLGSDHTEFALSDEPSLNLDLHSLEEDIPPVDMLSPISETTEPGGSLNNSMSSTHDKQEFLHQVHDIPQDTRGGILTPPKAQTPRKCTTQPHANGDSIPRGSYVISDVNHTPESACAAGIPIVNRESLNIRRSASSSHSSDGVMLYGSGFPHRLSNDAGDSSDITDQRYQLPSVTRSSNVVGQQYHSEDTAQRYGNNYGANEQPNYSDQRLKSGSSKHSFRNDGDHESQITDQRQTATNFWSHPRNDNRFSTFTKSKNRNENGKAMQSKEKIPSVTWFGVARSEESLMGADSKGHVGELGVRKTNWGEMASEVNESSNVIERGKVYY